MIAYDDIKIMVILKNKKIIGLFSLISLGFLIASVLIFLNYNDKPSYSINYKEIAEKEFLVSDFSGVDAYNDLTDNKYSLLHLNYHDSIWIVKIAEKKYIDTGQVEIWVLAGLKKYVLNREKKEVCTGWILFNKVSDSLSRNQMLINDYHRNPFLKKNVKLWIGQKIKEEIEYKFGLPSDVKSDELPNSYNSDIIDKTFIMEYEGLLFDIYHCSSSGKEILTNIEIYSSKYEMKYGLSVGAPSDLVLKTFGYPDEISINKMVYQIGDYYSIIFEFDSENKIDLIDFDTYID